MTKLLLVAGFIMALSTLTFAAANAEVPSAPATMVVNGQVVAVDYN